VISQLQNSVPEVVVCHKVSAPMKVENSLLLAQVMPKQVLQELQSELQLEVVE